MTENNITVKTMLPASGIRAVFDRAREIERNGKPVLHLEIGRPHWRLLPSVIADAKKALDQGFVHYIPNRGLPELLNSVAENIFATTGRKFDADKEIIITTGASEAISMCALALLGAGDEVIIPEPAWNHYRAVVEMSKATPVTLPLSANDGFLIDPRAVSGLITAHTRMMILNTPGNPTGAVQTAERLEGIAKLALKHGFFILSDEVYRDFVYEGKHVSISKYMGDSKLLLYVNSFSKSYAMTGWRIGYVASEAKISDGLNRIHQYLTVCGVSFAQKGAAALLRNPELKSYLDDLRMSFRERYFVWKEALEKCGKVQLVWPDGAFYLFPRIDYKRMNGREFCSYMLEEHGLAMVPGEIFGKDYSQHIRISYGLDLNTQRQASGKIVEVLNG